MRKLTKESFCEQTHFKSLILQYRRQLRQLFVWPPSGRATYPESLNYFWGKTFLIRQKKLSKARCLPQHEGAKSLAERRLSFKLFIQLSMMEIRVRKDTVHASTNRAKFSFWRLLDRDSTWKVFVTVKQTSGTIQRVSRVINRRTFLGCFMSSTPDKLKNY